jgi:hypothetical protein
MRLILQVFFFAASMSSLSQSAKAPQPPPFTVTITAAQAAARIGSPIMIHIVLKSTSEKQINLPEERHDGTHGEYNYQIIVKDLDNGAAPPDTEHGKKRKNHTEVISGSTIIKYLNYGDEVAEDVDLNNLVKITKPGDYEVQVERDDPLYSSLHIKSNTLTIHVTS